MKRSDVVTIAVLTPNVVLLAVGCFALYHAYSSASVVAMLVLMIGPLSAVTFVWQQRESVLSRRDNVGAWPRATFIIWNLIVLGGLAMPGVWGFGYHRPWNALLLLVFAVQNLAIAFWPTVAFGSQTDVPAA